MDEPAEAGRSRERRDPRDPQDPRTELEQLRRAMETRPVIDRAHGVLMATYGCTPDEAWQVLKSASQETNTKLHAVAVEITDTTQGRALSRAVRKAVGAALATLGKR
ncbi:ANTAR domain-containing protein [Streptomyces sp. WMMB 714]|uniref:ANTAR domain-containing protein n=1 Tax=Streptomyces sp. WMMB 714 TaxID=1286822 RepID=UPI000823BDDE|nr:ANTAR domain-containing protein [Streptomyces sp. WMMB 714]SCK13917.1 ANTAR domain-containing protein [Streptomyces sp. WMMB 714]